MSKVSTWLMHEFTGVLQACKRQRVAAMNIRVFSAASLQRTRARVGNVRFRQARQWRVRPRRRRWCLAAAPVAAENLRPLPDTALREPNASYENPLLLR